MKNIMIDIETLGVKPHSAVVEIVIVRFNMAGDLEKLLHLKINAVDNVSKGRRIDGDTIEWYLRNGIGLSLYDGVGLDEAIEKTQEVLKYYFTGETLFWANSPCFDFEILRDIGIDTPWSYGQERDVRTINHIYKLMVDRVDGYYEYKREEIMKTKAFIDKLSKHNAYDDCVSQIQKVILVNNFS